MTANNKQIVMSAYQRIFGDLDMSVGPVANFWA